MARQRFQRAKTPFHRQFRVFPLLVLCAVAVCPTSARWEPCGPEDAFDIADVLVDPNDPRTVYAIESTSSSEGSLATWKSTDGARSWSRLKLGSSSRVIAVDPARPGSLYAVSRHGLLRSSDAGANWSELGLITAPSSPVSIFALEVDDRPRPND